MHQKRVKMKQMMHFRFTSVVYLGERGVAGLRRRVNLRKCRSEGVGEGRLEQGR